jgi:hypothetical protein
MRRKSARCDIRQLRARLTVIVNSARRVLALESVAEHLTLVRPGLKKPPERGVQATGTGPSTASWAVTV